MLWPLFCETTTWLIVWCTPLGFQLKDAREKLGQKDARFWIRGRGGAAAGGGGGSGSGVQDARQMINSRKQQGQIPVGNPLQLNKPLVAGLQATFQVHNNNGTTSANVRQFPSAPQGLNVRAGLLPQPGGGIKKVVDARDRLSLKRSITGAAATTTQTPLKITKTIQVGGIPCNLLLLDHWCILICYHLYGTTWLISMKFG